MAILDVHVQFQIEWATLSGENTLHVVAVHVSLGIELYNNNKKKEGHCIMAQLFWLECGDNYCNHETHRLVYTAYGFLKMAAVSSGY